MAQHIRIQMMDRFMIYIDEQRMDQLSVKSRKGAALVQYLIINGGAQVMSVTLDTGPEAEGISFLAKGAAKMDILKYEIV